MHTDDAAARQLFAPAAVEGRVFERLARFRLLPPTLKLRADAAAAYLLAPCVFPTVFARPSSLHRARGWLRCLCGAPTTASANPRVSGARLLRALRRYLQLTDGLDARDADAAAQLAQTLVLSGLLSPEVEVAPSRSRNDDHDDHDDQAEDNDDDDRFDDEHVPDDSRTLLELVAPGARGLRLTDDHVVSVWDVTDGALCAGEVFRRPSRVCDRGCGGGWSCTKRERRVYAVVNGPSRHALAFFRDDVARQQLALIPLRGAVAQYAALSDCMPPLFHGLQVWFPPARNGSSRSQCETLDFMNKHTQERWLHALLSAGAAYRETHARAAHWAAPTESFYALSIDRQRRPSHLEARTMNMEALRGRVVLVVNAPPSALAHWHDGELGVLMGLAERWAPDGLSLLVLPCAQFSNHNHYNRNNCNNRNRNNISNNNNDNDDDHRRHHNDNDDEQDGDWPPGVEVLAPGDANGPYAAELFVFLNARLPGHKGQYVDGDYCKFLVDRRGRPAARLLPAQDAHEPTRALLDLKLDLNDGA